MVAAMKLTPDFFPKIPEGVDLATTPVSDVVEAALKQNSKL